MKSSSSEESVRKRSHSVGGNSLAPSTLSTMTTTNICDINDTVMDSGKQDIIGKDWQALYSVIFKDMQFFKTHEKLHFVNRWHKEIHLSRWTACIWNVYGIYGFGIE